MSLCSIVFYRLLFKKPVVRKRCVGCVPWFWACTAGWGGFCTQEQVSIALDEGAAAAWMEAGEVWKAIKFLQLTFISVKETRAGRSRETRSTYIFILPVYASTAKIPPATKQFMEDLQDASTSNVMVILKDMNAHVGSTIGNNDVWQWVHGKHSVSRCSEASEKLLNFCSLNQLTIMNMWFE